MVAEELVELVEVVAVAMCAPTATLKAPKLSIVAVASTRFRRAASRSESALERRAGGAEDWRGIGGNSLGGEMGDGAVAGINAERLRLVSIYLLLPFSAD